jgi:hypothetical protein
MLIPRDRQGSRASRHSGTVPVLLFYYLFPRLFILVLPLEGMLIGGGSVPGPWHFGMDPCTVRIRISWSVPLTSGSGWGSCSFRQWPSRCHLCFAYSFLKVIFTSLFKDKKVIKSHKTVEIKIFLHFFACRCKDPDPYKSLPSTVNVRTFAKI